MYFKFSTGNGGKQYDSQNSAQSLTEVIVFEPAVATFHDFSWVTKSTIRFHVQYSIDFCFVDIKNKHLEEKQRRANKSRLLIISNLHLTIASRAYFYVVVKKIGFE